MYKKLMTACLALVAFAAFVLPASAMAENTPILKDSTGTVAVGSLITGTNSGNAVFWNTATNIEQVTCSKAVLTGKVLKNTTGEVEGEITTAHYSGTGAVSADNNLNECTTSFGSAYITVKNLPLIIKSNKTMPTDTFTVTGPAGAKVKFLIGSTTAGECEYESTGALDGDFTTGTGPGASIFTITDTQAASGSKLIRGGFLCPSSGMLHQTFTMETDNAGAAPIWVEP